MTKISALLQNPNTDGNFTVISNEEAVLFQKLKDMYLEVCDLTVNHDVINDHAVVYPSKLGPVLEKIDKKWYMSSL
jgi:hypothetical protein